MPASPADAAPLAFEVLTSTDALRAEGFGDNPFPVFAEVSGPRVLFQAGLGNDPDPEVFLLGPSGVKTEQLTLGETLPNTGNPALAFYSYGFLDAGTGAGDTFVVAGSRPTGQTTGLNIGVYTRAGGTGPLATLAETPTTLASLPNPFQAEGGLGGYVVAGADPLGPAGFYLGAVGASAPAALPRVLAPGAAITNRPGTTIGSLAFAGDGSLDGGTVVARVTDSAGTNLLARLAPGAATALVAEGDRVDLGDGLRSDVRFLSKAVSSDGRAVARVTLDTFRPTGRVEREALLAFDAAGGAPEVLFVTDGVGRDTLANDLLAGGLAVDGEATVFSLLTDGETEVYYDAGADVEPVLLLSSGDFLGDDELLDVIFTPEALEGDRFVFTALFARPGGTGEFALVSATVPEPAGGAALLAGAGLVLRRRRG